MNLTINGETKSIEASQSWLSLTNLIEQLGHHPLLIVVELNGTILPPGNWDQQKISCYNAVLHSGLADNGNLSAIGSQSNCLFVSCL